MIDKNDRIVVTGSTGFLGRAVVRQLAKQGYQNIVGLSSKSYDLEDERAVAAMYLVEKPQVVIHLAAMCGGIGANMQRPADFFLSNMKMGINIIDYANLYAKNREFKKLVFTSTICAYPKHTPVPFAESDLWNGFPEETNAAYAVAKKSLGVMLDAYHAQYGLKSCVLMPTNLYGIFDTFDPNRSHVIPALIRKIEAAIEHNVSEVKVWGDGSPSRDFLYVDDAANGIIAGMEKLDHPLPINLGSGREVTISELVKILVDVMGFSGEVVWDSSMPNGQPRRCLSNERANNLLGWSPQMSLEDGLKSTVKYFRAMKGSL